MTILLLIQLLVHLIAGSCVAQVPSPTVVRTPSAREIAREQKRQLTADLLKFNRDHAAQLQEGSTSSKTPAQEIVRLYEEGLLALDQQLNILDALKTHGEEFEQLKAEIQKLPGESQRKPVSISYLDELRDKLRQEQSAARGLKADLDKSSGLRQEGEVALEQAQAARRLLAEDNSQPEDAEATLALKKAELQVLVARLLLDVRKLDVQVKEQQLASSELRMRGLQQKESLMSSNVRFTTEELEDRLLDLERKTAETERAIEAAKLSAKALEQKWLAIKGDVLSNATRDRTLEARASTYQRARELKQIELASLTERLKAYKVLKRTWERRFAVYNSKASDEEKTSWAEDAQTDLDQIERDARISASQAEDLRRGILALNQNSQTTIADSSATSQWQQVQEDNLKSAADTVEGTLATLAAVRSLDRFFLEELGASTHPGYLKGMLRSAWFGVTNVWHYELAAVDDKPITAGKIISAIVLLSLGFWLSRKLSNLLGRLVLPKLGLQDGGLLAIQSILFYLLIVFFALAALQIVSVPLTLFTFVGGALAIGIGFGSQNIMSNFISGLIMLVEQHVRVGDLIEVNNLQGTVKHVGPRSTIIRTGDNIDIVVPNSSFLDKHVVNWTLCDNMIRLVVQVGVSYDSDTQLVTKLLLQAAEENLHALSNPKPMVFLTAFSDNTLDFELACFVFIGSILSAGAVKSELRYRIHELFLENGITIAFPQRDVHLEIDKPVEIKLAKVE